jgi:anhydro-N-acetylmuramic acid kinase
MLAVGVMSGTSLDGVDAALVDIVPRDASYAVHLRRFEVLPFEPALRAALAAVLPPNDGTVAQAARLHRGLGRCFGEAARCAADGERVGYVASHGQTVWHDGGGHVTFQLGDAFAIREAVGATVCYDFRSADTAAGGHGAPLVARVDALLLGSDREDRVALNLGGIANVTLLRAGASPEAAIAFDTGPGVMLLDGFVRERTAGKADYDRDGRLAAAGRCDERLLAAMLEDSYFAQSPPKTTGRERFGAQFLARHGDALARLCVEDGAATLTELSAVAIAQALARHGFERARVIASGGGARNAALRARLTARLGGSRVETSDAMGIPTDAKEAIAFAVLGYELLRGRAANVPAATGAARAVVLGAIAPHHLDELLGAIGRECAAAT